MKKNIGYGMYKFNLFLAVAFLGVFSAAPVSFPLGGKALAASDATLSLVTTPQTVSIGDTFVLVANENPGTNANVRAVDIFIQFDPATLRLDSIVNNDTNFNSQMANNIPPATAAGIASFGTARIGGAALVGAKDVATFHFTALAAAANSAIIFTSGTAVWDSGVNVTASGGLTGAMITVGNPPPVTYNSTDFTALTAHWLQTVSGGREVGNVNADNKVNSRDLGIMMSNWQN